MSRGATGTRVRFFPEQSHPGTRGVGNRARTVSWEWSPASVGLTGMTTTGADRASREIDKLLVSAKALRQELRTKEANYRRMSRLLQRGVDMRIALRSVNAITARQELSAALDAFERSRHQAKVAVATEGIRQGMTISEIGRAWGVSRQLAARYVKQGRDLG